VRLRGENGFEVRVITYGAALLSIFAPDRAGRLADVVLGRDDLAAISRSGASWALPSGATPTGSRTARSNWMERVSVADQ
jgi:Aldose 1-epimerase.